MNSFFVMCGFLILSMATWFYCPSVREGLTVGGIPMAIYILGLLCAIALPHIIDKKRETC